MSDEKTYDAANPLALLDMSEGDIKAAVAAADPKPTPEAILALVAAEEGGKTRKGVTAFLVELRDAPAREAERVAAEEAARVEAERVAAASPDLLAFTAGGAVSGDVPDAIKAGPVQLVIGDGGGEIAGLNRIAAEAGDFEIVGERAMYRKPIAIEGADVAATIEAIALADEAGAVMAVCDIPGGLPLYGRNAEFPAGSLIFG